jgi:hypothetical protein
MWMHDALARCAIAGRALPRARLVAVALRSRAPGRPQRRAGAWSTACACSSSARALRRDRRLILADNGADVIKLEPPGGDPLREHPAFAWAAREQRLVADLAVARDRERVTQARGGGGRRASSFRPGVDARFGLDPAAILARHPQAIVCRITGFGAAGALRAPPRVDGIVAAKAGRMLEFCGLVGGAAAGLRRRAGRRLERLAARLARDPRGAARSRTHGRGRRVETSLVQGLAIYDLVNWLPGYTMTLRVADVPYLPYANAYTQMVSGSSSRSSRRGSSGPSSATSARRDLGRPALPLRAALRDPEQMRALRARVLARVREKTHAGGCASSTRTPTSPSSASGRRSRRWITRS